MAELSEQQEQEVVVPQKAKRTNGSFWFGIVILLIVVGVSGAGFYLFTQLRERQEGLGGEVKGQLTQQIADYQSQLVAIQNQLAGLENNIGSKDDHFTKTLADFSRLHNEKLESTRKELTESILHLQRQLGKTRGDWLIADAEYLLSVANERLHLVGDVNTTREALEAADQRLRESGDAGVFQVREQIAKEIILLRSVHETDVVGIYSTLQALESKVDQLAMLLPYSGKPLTQADKTDKSNAEGNEKTDDLLDSANTLLHGLATIRHYEQAVKEILTPEQADFIREQLRVKLGLIKVALVEHNEAIYQASLADAENWLEKHFAQNDMTNTLVSELGRLAAIKLRSQYPDISQSLTMLKNISKLRVEADKVLGMDGQTGKTDLAEPAKPTEEPVLEEAVKPTTPPPAQ